MDRVKNIRDRFDDYGINGLLVQSPDNRRYISGFTGTAGSLIISRDQAVLATDFRYIEQATTQSPEFRILRTFGALDWLPDLVGDLGITNLGFESEHLSFAMHQRIADTVASAGLPIDLIPVHALVEEVRKIKDQLEMDSLVRAIDISDRAFDEVSKTIFVGQTEREIAWLLEKTMRELGADSPSFDTIVAAGPNAALPHHRPDDTKIQNGTPLIIDMGAKYEGYCSDLSRTLFIGTPDDRFVSIYDTVLAAQLTAIATVQSGMTGSEADNLARLVIDEAGYGDKFGHSLGHGVGLEIHEQPGVGPGSQTILSDGMPFTIEPGIYISGWGGVRIEDVVVLEEGQARVISKASKLDRLGG
tara:strand:+ start:2560 stop:3636 length:1077 start_codon:yes stop_codon:yes gene_type:complete